MYLSKDIISSAIVEHVYEVSDDKECVSRCFTQTQYEPGSFIPALSLPGGDAGELAILIAAANQYGFEYDFEVISQLITELGQPAIEATDSSYHLRQLLQKPHVYGLEKDIQLVEKYIKKHQNKYQNLEMRKRFSGVIIVESNHGVTPNWEVETDAGIIKLPLIIIHKTLIDKRHRLLAQRLIEHKGVTLYQDLGLDYLYEVLSEMTDVHAMETLKQLDSQLPLFSLKEKEHGIFTVEQLM